MKSDTVEIQKDGTKNVEVKVETQVQNLLNKKLEKAVEKIIEKLGAQEQRHSENCSILTTPSKLCPDTGIYPTLKGLNVTETEARVKAVLDKSGRQDINESGLCLVNLRNLLCLQEFQKCSPEGDLLPVCSKVRVEVLNSCSNPASTDEKEVSQLIDSLLDSSKISNSTDTTTCYVGVKHEDKKDKAKQTKEDKKGKRGVTGSDDSNGDKDSDQVGSATTTSPSLAPKETWVESLWDCSRYSYMAKWGNQSCFADKGENRTKMPTLKDVTMGKMEFGFKDNVKCNDTLKLLSVQVDEPCGCDTKLSHVRSPCVSALSSIGIHTESLMVSFRDVEYTKGLENQIHTVKDPSGKKMNHHNMRRQFDDDKLDDMNDPMYAHRFYYKTCNRLNGVPKSTNYKHCSRKAKLDKYENPNTEVEMYTNFKKDKIKEKFRSGCTVLDCLNHMRYLPPLKHVGDNNLKVFQDDGTIDDKFDICKEEIKDCPAWSFGSDGISISGYPANITSFLEVDVQAKNSSRAAIIFSFRALSQPLYEGFRFLLNGVPAMPMVYNQTEHVGYAVPLLPGQSHVARWEFIRGEASSSTSFNYADIQAIVLRDAKLATPLDTIGLKSIPHLTNNKVHLPPQAPTRPGISSTTPIFSQDGAILEGSSSLNIIPMLVILLTWATIAAVGIVLWRRHQKKKREQEDFPLGSYTAPLGFAERVAQFALPGRNNDSQPESRYAPLPKPDQPHLELNTLKSFQNHLPNPTHEEDESAFDRQASPPLSTRASSSSTTLNMKSPSKPVDDLL